MSDDNVVPLFPEETSKQGSTATALVPQESIFFHFPKGTRFEFTKSGEMIISLDPNVEDIVKHTWASYINATCVALILNHIEHRIQYQRDANGEHTIPDVLRISMVKKSNAQQQSP